MDPTDLLEIGAVVFLSIAGGIVVGARVALGMAGEFVDESLSAVRTLAYELLANKTLQAAVRAAEKFGGGGGGGVIGAIVSKVAGGLGFKLPALGGGKGE